MTLCKKSIIAIFLFVLPLTLWSGVPVVDESDNFAMSEEQQDWDSRYEAQSRFERGRTRSANSKYSMPYEEETPLVKEDNQELGSRSKVKDNAKLIDKVQSLRQEIQELRGQLEVQAHDIKLLQQQQLSFYKDLDSRIGSMPAKTIESKPAINPSAEIAPMASPVSESSTQAKPGQTSPTLNRPLNTVSRVNPADEQISYLAAYELIKNKRYDEALLAMQVFVQKYPQGGYTANAEYWLGELYLLRKEYSKSLSHFETVLERFPASSKAAASMLKGGYVYAASGDILSARKRLQEVIKTYPKTVYAQMASAKLVSLNAS